MVSNSDLYAIRSENARLQREVNEKSRELNHWRNENNQLQSEINSMVNAISNTKSTVENVLGRTVNGLASDTVSVNGSNATLEQAYEMQEEIEEKYSLFKNMEKAYKTVRELNNIIKYQMANHEKIKKLAYAAIDNLNTGDNDSQLVSSENLRKEIEKVYLTGANTEGSVIDFWLTYVLLHIFQEEAKEYSAAERSMAEAEKLNATSTYIFMFLYRMCAKHYEEASAWFDKIPNKQDLFKSEKFMLFFFLVKMSEEYKTGYAPLDNKLIKVWDDFFANETPNTSHIVDKILNWYYENTICRYYSSEDDADKSGKIEYEEAMSKPQVLIDKITEKGQSFKLTKTHVSEYNNMMLSLAIASENERISSLIDTFENGELKNYYGNFVHYMVDDFIDKASTPKMDEIKKQIEENEAIIACNGDLAKVQTYLFKLRTERARTTSSDYMYKWLNNNEQEYAMQEKVKKYAFIALKKLYLEAYKKYQNQYTSIRPQNYHLTIDGFKLETRMNNQEEDEKTIKDHFKKKAKELKASIKKWPAVLFSILAALAIGGGVYLLISQTGPWSGMLYGLGCFAASIVFLAIALSRLYKNKKKETKIDIEIEEEYRSILNVLKQIYSEYKENYMATYKSVDGISKSIKERLS